MRIVQLAPGSPFLGPVLTMRLDLWRHLDAAANERELRQILDRPEAFPVFVALAPSGEPAGFAEARLRDYAEGCETSPVGYLEAWYVRPDFRKQGVGRALVEAVENWARAQGATEIASDTEIDNHASELAHKALNFELADRIICFRKRLG
jgi:aminoglycoside 6'-N-acetyltransferase I